jgi:hypothetical protein
MVNLIATIGGLFAVFTFVYFFVDWLLQTHAEAMVKHNNWKVRARHCVIYTVGFIPLMWLVKFTALEVVIGLNILFWSHFYLDTYHGVYLWCKYIRKPPEIVNAKDPKEGFVAFVQTTLGKILLIAVDQIFHLLFLLLICCCFVISKI